MLGSVYMARLTWLTLRHYTVQVLRVTDFQGAWVRLAPETEAQAGRVCPPYIGYEIDGWLGLLVKEIEA